MCNFPGRQLEKTTSLKGMVEGGKGEQRNSVVISKGNWLNIKFNERGFRPCASRGVGGSFSGNLGDGVGRLYK